MIGLMRMTRFGITPTRAFSANGRRAATLQRRTRWNSRSTTAATAVFARRVARISAVVRAIAIVARAHRAPLRTRMLMSVGARARARTDRLLRRSDLCVSRAPSVSQAACVCVYRVARRDAIASRDKLDKHNAA